MKLPFLSSIFVASAAMMAGAFGQLYVPNFANYGSMLGGTNSTYIWDGFNAEYPPGTLQSSVNGAASQWPGGLVPTNNASGIIFSGNPSFGSDTTDFLSTASGGGIYAFFSQTHFQINSTVPLSNLEALTLQLSFAEGLSGAFGGASMGLVANPTLTLITTAGTFVLNASYTSLSDHSTATINGSSSFVDMMNYQWDLSTVAGTPLSYTINWQNTYHSVTLGEQVTESSAVTHNDVLLQAVPEPSTAVTLMGGLGLLFMVRRPRRMVLGLGSSVSESSAAL